MPNEGQQAPFYPSRPILKLDGQDNPALSDALLTLFVEETTLGLARCEAHFGNWGPKNNSVDFLFFDRQAIDFGKELSVKVGPADSTAEIFKGRIAGIEAQYPSQRDPELSVLAEDRFQDLRMERRTRSFENMSDSDVISTIASQHGLTPQVDANGPTYRVLTQLNQSDLAFLRERAAAIDAELWLDDRTLHVQAHTKSHAWHFISDRIVDFHHPEASYFWLEWNRYPLEKHAWLTRDFRARVPWGTPVYEFQPALLQAGYQDDPDVTRYATDQTPRPATIANVAIEMASARSPRQPYTSGAL